MPTIIDGTAGITFPNSTIQASAGVVLQVVTGLSLVSDVTASTTYVASSLQATITPKFSTSKILVLVSGNIYGNQYTTIYRGGSDLSTTANGFMPSNVTNLMPASASVLDSPATTSATTYRVYLKAISGNAYWNIAQGTTTITLLEIAG